MTCLLGTCSRCLSRASRLSPCSWLHRHEGYARKVVNLPPGNVSRAFYSSPVLNHKGLSHVFWDHCRLLRLGESTVIPSWQVAPCHRVVQLQELNTVLAVGVVRQSISALADFKRTESEPEFERLVPSQVIAYYW